MRGRVVAHYRLLDLIGSGGMGEVYRALDTTLGREVAIKVLPSTHTSDPEGLARLRREARTLAALNHPGIATVHGLEELDQTSFLVMELVTGRTVAALLASGPIPLRDALDIADQMADALEAAHDRGVIHRDIKPANVMITPEGRVKLLDFGLARAFWPGHAPDSQPTDQARVTGTGMIAGTLAYMSPEQLRGLPLDQRSDVWAFGAVLFELLAHQRLFAAPAAADIISTVLHGDPALAGLPLATPPAVRRLLTRCLREDPRRRLRNLGDARLDLADARESPSDRVEVRASAERRPVQFLRITDAVGPHESPAISPDGKMVAFVAHAGARRHIWVRLLAGGAPLQITRDDTDHAEPRWTPDSSALVYYTSSAVPGAPGTLWEVSALGGQPRPVAAALGGGDISHDGRHLAAFQLHDGQTQLAIVPRDGGTTVYLAMPSEGTIFGNPRWAPDDRTIACQVDVTPHFDVRIYLVTLATHEVREITRGVALKGLAWLPDGSGLVCASSYGSTVLYPPNFNFHRVAPDGRRGAALTFGDSSHVHPDLHSSGRIVASRGRGRSDIWRFPLDGTPDENTRGGVRVTRQTGHVQAPAVSGDGSELVYLSDSGGHGNLWIIRADGSSGARQITFERDLDAAVGVGIWSTTGRTIAVVITRRGQSALWLVESDGTGFREVAPHGFAAGWSPDDKWLYYTPTFEGGARIVKVTLDAGATPVPVRQDAAMLLAVAPDGSGIYYSRRPRPDLWDFEICRAFPEDGPSEVIGRVDGARVPVSRALLQAALSPDGAWLAMPLSDGPTTNLWLMPTAGGPPRRVTDFRHAVMIARRVAWSPDNRSLYAAVAEMESDIVLYDGLLD